MSGPVELYEFLSEEPAPLHAESLLIESVIRGALLMLSMPPAKIVSPLSACKRSVASIIAFIPEPQTLLIVVAPQASGRPAFLMACLAGACLSPAPTTLPKIASLILDSSILA